MKRVLKRPIVWAPILMWAALTLLAQRFLPVAPTHRFDLEAANRARDQLPIREWRIADLSPDGESIACSEVIRPGALHEPIDEHRLWNVKTGAMTSRNSPTGDFFPHFSPNPWYAVWTEAPRAYRRSGPNDRNPRGFVDFSSNYTHFVHRDTGKKSSQCWGEYVQSPSGRLVATNDGIANHLLDLETDKTRHFFVTPTVEQASLVPFRPQCFSQDERLLAGTVGDSIVIVDVQSGQIVATLPDGGGLGGGYARKMFFSPDGQSLVWQQDRAVMVADWKVKRAPCVIANKKFVAWQPSGRVLVTNWDTYRVPCRQLESWDWRENRKVAEWNLSDDYHLVVAHMKQWAIPPETYIALSPDGRHVLFAGYVENAKSAPWFAKLREWLGKPAERDIHLEVFLLDGDDLTLRHHWQIPAERHRDVILQFTSDNRSLVFTDEHTVEHWPIPPHSSWLTSALWTGGATIVLALPIVLWRYWRGRKKQKAATAPTPEGAA